MHGLIREGNAVVSGAPEGALRDALMITSAQKVEHYEMASYGTARTYAQVLGQPRVARLLQDTLEEEKKADAKLTEIAERKINEQAAEEWHHVTEGLLLQTVAFAGKAVGIGARTIKRAAGAVGLPQRTGSGDASTTAVRQITSSSNRAADSAGETATELGRAGSRARRATEGGRQASRQQATTRKPSRTRSKQSANKHAPRSRGR